MSKYVAQYRVTLRNVQIQGWPQSVPMYLISKYELSEIWNLNLNNKKKTTKPAQTLRRPPLREKPNKMDIHYRPQSLGRLNI